MKKYYVGYDSVVADLGGGGDDGAIDVEREGLG